LRENSIKEVSENNGIKSKNLSLSNRGVCVVRKSSIEQTRPTSPPYSIAAFWDVFCWTARDEARRIVRRVSGITEISRMKYRGTIRHRKAIIPLIVPCLLSLIESKNTRHDLTIYINDKQFYINE